MGLHFDPVSMVRLRACACVRRAGGAFGAMGACAILLAASTSLRAEELSAPPAPDAAAAPCIEVAEAEFDFGTIYQGEEVAHTFAFRNTGGSPLHIDKITSTCGCAAALPEPREAAPGQSGAISVTFRSGMMRNRVSKKISVHTNDPAKPVVQLTFKGEVKVEVEVHPHSVFIGRVGLGQTVRKSVEIVPVEAQSLRIAAAKTSDPLVHVGEPVPLAGKPGGYRLTIDFGPARVPGKVMARVTLATDLPHTRELVIVVFGTIAGPDAAPKLKAGPRPKAGTETKVEPRLD